MSISVEDLVASLNANHIGQEAMDIADLQAQLTRTLHCTTSQPPSLAHGAAPCNTPTARTPSSTWCHLVELGRHRSPSITSASAKRSTIDRELDIAEEAMDTEEVEDILGYAPPISATTSAHFPPDPSQFPSSNSNRQSWHFYPSFDGIESTSPNCSTFATTDPFFVAAQMPPPPTNSMFTQIGRPSPQSPFYSHPQQQNRSVPIPLSLESRPRYVSTGFGG